jgi:hypothetical protein
MARRASRARAEAPRRGRLLAGLVAASMALVAVGAMAQAASAPPRSGAAKPAPEQGVRWSELKPAEQAVLKPLEREWPGIAAQRKQKWRELSARFPKLSSDEQARVQTRMAQWARLTPQERTQARLNFQEAKDLPPQARQERWQAYQALTPEQRQELAQRTVREPGPGEDPRVPGTTAARAGGERRDGAQAKSNIVPDPSPASPPKPVSPTVVRAPAGATTTLITKRPSPPPHQQPGMPKIAATPEFVDRATLLPNRGPQGAPTRSAAASASAPPPRP